MFWELSKWTSQGNFKISKRQLQTHWKRNSRKNRNSAAISRSQIHKNPNLNKIVKAIIKNWNRLKKRHWRVVYAASGTKNVGNSVRTNFKIP